MYYTISVPNHDNLPKNTATEGTKVAKKFTTDTEARRK